jgi:hypothetical protein
MQVSPPDSYLGSSINTRSRLSGCTKRKTRALIKIQNDLRRLDFLQAMTEFRAEVDFDACENGGSQSGKNHQCSAVLTLPQQCPCGMKAREKAKFSLKF